MTERAVSASPSRWVSRSRETYKRWYDAGAHRYLLRIEIVKSRSLPQGSHPDDGMHRLR
ncbi:MAG: hypothetical protein MZV63_05625 [Marinilabiliales bacterium]|nr:hypothetical protein [Marinilabiliales bacterium]